MKNQVEPLNNGDFRVLTDPIPEDSITFRFYDQNPQEIIRIAADGNVYWKGRLVESDSDFKSAMLDLKDSLMKAQATPHEYPLKGNPSDCWCWNCTQDRTRMIVCPTCGNKRCPHATDHNLPCTNSNEPGQEGSRY